MTYFFAPSLLFVNFCPMHNGCGVSESGWSWDLGLVGMRGRKRERDMKGEMERWRDGEGKMGSIRLTETLSQV